MKKRVAPVKLSRTNRPARADVRFIGPKDKSFRLSADLKAFLQTLLRLLLKALNQKSASIFLLDEQGECLHRVASEGLSPRYLRKVPKIKVKEILTWREILGKGRIAFRDISNDPRVASRGELMKEGINSLLTVPLTVGDSTIGLVGIYSREKSRFSKETLDLLQFVGVLIGMALERAKLQEEEKNTSDFLKGLHNVALDILSIRDIQKVLRKVLLEAKKILNADRVILRLKKNDGIFTPPISVGIKVPSLDGASMNLASLGRLVTKTGTIQWSEDFTTDPRVRDDFTIQLVMKQGLVAGIAVPCTIRGKLLGYLVSTYTHPRQFSEHDKFVMSSLANQAAVAIENAQLYSHLTARADELARLQEEERNTSDFLKGLHGVALEILSVRDSKKLLEKVLLEAKRILKADRVALRLRMPGGAFSQAVTVGVKVPSLDSGAKKLRGISGLAAKTEEVHWTDNYAGDPRERGNPNAVALMKHGIVSGIASPMKSKERVTGVLIAMYAKSKIFSEQDKFMISTFANQAALAIENAGLYSRMSARADELARLQEEEKSTSDFLKGLHGVALEILSFKDPEKVLERVVLEAKRIMKADRVALRLKTRGGLFPLSTFAGIEVHSPDVAISRLTGIGQLVVETGQVHWSDNYAVDLHRKSNPVEEALLKEGIASGIASALKIRGKVIGCLFAMYRQPNRFTGRDKFTISTFANQAAVAIENARLYSRISARADELARLQEEEKSTSNFLKGLHGVALEILSVRDSKKLLEKVLLEAKRILKADRVALRLRMPGGVFAKGVSVGVKVPSLGSGAKKFMGVGGLAAKTGEVQWTDNYAGDPREQGNPNAVALMKHGLVSGIASPMKSRKKVTGVLIAMYAKSKIFSEQDKFMISTFAGQAAVAIENTRLYSRLAARADELARLQEEEKSTSDFLKGLHKVSLEILSVRDAQSVLRKVLLEAKRILKADRVILRLRGRGGSLFRPIGVGLKVPQLDKMKVISGGLGRRVFKSGKVQWSDNYATDPQIRDHSIIRTMIKRGFISGIAAPLNIKGKLTGYLVANYTQSRRFSEQDEFVMSTFANQAAVAIENARLYQELKDKEQRLRAYVDMLINAQEEERKRVARDVHDELAQLLVSSGQHMSIVKEEVLSLPPAKRHEFQIGLDRLKLAIETVRKLISELRPPVVDSMGLAGAVKNFLQKLAREHGWQLEFVQNLGNLRLPSNLEIGVYRVVQEAITNVKKHADSQRVRVSLTKEKGVLSIEMQDWGKGFDVQRVRKQKKCFGLLGMSERAAILAGSCNVLSTPGKGTRVKVQLPLLQEG